MQVERVLESCLYVDNLEAAKVFYQQVLGLELLAVTPGRHAFFRCGDGVFFALQPPGDRAAGQQRSVARRTRTWSRCLCRLPGRTGRLQAHDVPIETEVSWPGGGQSLYLRDPAGNSVELATPQTWGLA